MVARDDIGVEQVIVVVQHRDLFARHVSVEQAHLMPEDAVAGVLDEVHVIAEIQIVRLDKRGKLAPEALKVGIADAFAVQFRVDLIVRQIAEDKVLDRVRQDVADAKAVDIADAEPDQVLPDEIMDRSLCHFVSSLFAPSL